MTDTEYSQWVTTNRIAPSIQSELRKVTTELREKYSKSWSSTKLINLALLEFLENFRINNEKEVNQLLEKYKHLQTEQ